MSKSHPRNLRNLRTSIKPTIQKWHIFVILIVSCMSMIVAPTNMSIIASIGMEVYNSLLKFQRDCIYIS